MVSPAKSSFCPASKARSSASRYFARNITESARTGKRNPRLAGIDRPSGERTAADHTVHMQMLAALRPQVWSTLVIPISAPELIRGIPKPQGLQGVRGRRQEAVDHLRISLGERVDLMG